MNPPSAYPLHAIVIQRRKEKIKKEKRKNKQSNFRSAILLARPFTGIATVPTGGCQLERKWHALTSIIQNLTSSLCFSSPPLFLCLSLLFFELQAAHRPHRAHEAAAEHYHLPDMGQQKPKPYGYVGKGRLVVSHAATILTQLVLTRHKWCGLQKRNN